MPLRRKTKMWKINNMTCQLPCLVAICMLLLRSQGCRIQTGRLMLTGKTGWLWMEKEIYRRHMYINLKTQTSNSTNLLMYLLKFGYSVLGDHKWLLSLEHTYPSSRLLVFVKNLLRLQSIFPIDYSMHKFRVP